MRNRKQKNHIQQPQQQAETQNKHTVIQTSQSRFMAFDKNMFNFLG